MIMMYVVIVPSVETDVLKEERKQLFHIAKKYGDAKDKYGDK